MFADKAKQIDNMPMSDTRLFSFLVNKNGFLKMVNELRPPGVWLHMKYDGSLAVSKRGGSLCFSPKLGAWGSEAPRSDTNWFDVDDATYEYDEEPVLLQRERYARMPRIVQHVMSGY